MPIRVASIPQGHPYVLHLGEPDGPQAVHRLPDPRPAVAQVSAGQWWPPRMLDLDWLDDHHQDIDLVHLHFGFDEASPEHLQQWTARLARYGLPLVVTVHDLFNPHFVDDRLHQQQLDVLLPAASALITLTPAAAERVRSRWDATPTVIAHPHIVPLDRIGRPRPEHPEFVVGLHVKNLRANVDPVPLLAAITAALPTLPGVILRLDLHPEVLLVTNQDQRATDLRQWISEVHDRPDIRVEAHPRLDDEQLWAYLEAIDLCVLPYRFGTHSGWLEACVDLGTAVLVPETGCYADQHGHPTFSGEADLARAIRTVVADPGRARPPRPDRRRQREQIAAAHERLYRRVLTPGR